MRQVEEILFMHWSCPPYLGRRHKHSSEGVKPRHAPIPTVRVTGGVLEVKHAGGWTEEVREVVQEHQAVPQHGDLHRLQVVVLHGNQAWQLASTHWLVGGPGEAVGGATRHTVYFLA